jgi:hypothetical protein
MVAAGGRQRLAGGLGADIMRNRNSGGHHDHLGGFRLGCGQRDRAQRHPNPALFVAFLEPEPDETDGPRTRARRRGPQLHRRRS